MSPSAINGGLTTAISRFFLTRWNPSIRSFIGVVKKNYSKRSARGPSYMFHGVMQRFMMFVSPSLWVLLLRHLVLRKAPGVSVKITPWNQGDWFCSTRICGGNAWILVWCWFFTDSTHGKSPIKPPFGEKPVVFFNHLKQNGRKCCWFFGGRRWDGNFGPIFEAAGR